MTTPPPGPRRLAAVFPHPDDESLFAGGLLAAAARAGAEVRLLCLTRGEAGWSRFGERGPALAARRRAELHDACRALGIAAPDVRTLPDGALTGQDPDEAASLVGACLDEIRPQVVVSFGPDGAYGHADHIACAGWVRRAVEGRGPALRLLQTAFAPGTFDATRRNLDRFAGPQLLPLPPEALGSEVGAGELQLTLDPELARRKRDAVAAHDSQLPGGDPDRMLAPGLLRELCVRERYRVAHGPAFGAEPAHDPFEGLP